MFSNVSVVISQSVLNLVGTEISVWHRERIPESLDCGAIVASNHRSFLDAFVLMSALDRPVRFACHHYMGQTPLLREFVELLGCFPLEQPEKRQQCFFKQANELLQNKEWVGIFPEGGEPMVNLTPPARVSKFERGFAHLALRASIPNIVIVPVAIASVQETTGQSFPLKFLHLLDPSEALFDSWNLQPVIIYHRLQVAIGRPYWVSSKQRDRYRGKGAKLVVEEINSYCRQEIATLVERSCR